MDKINPSIKDFMPVEGYILVKPLDRSSGDGITTIVEDFPQLAEVVSVGKDTQNTYTDREVKTPCEKGDMILHSAGGFETLKFEGEEYRIVHFTKILAVNK